MKLLGELAITAAGAAILIALWAACQLARVGVCLGLVMGLETTPPRLYGLIMLLGVGLAVYVMMARVWGWP